MIYSNYERNHVILPGRNQALKSFLKKGYKGINHKWKHGFSSNSEDALTWSCFDIISQIPFAKKVKALDEILEDSFQGNKCNFTFAGNTYHDIDIQIYIGKEYRGYTINEETEVDASIELPDKIIFFEAKLYSSISLVDKSKNKPHDQIARKLRVGLDYANSTNKEFYFILLDIAPPSELLKFTKEKNKKKALDSSKDKWKTAWWFNYYKNGRNNSLKPLTVALAGIKNVSVKSVSDNMGWLTWADLFKIVMRGVI
jgi:hypothetical protein